MSEYCKHCGRRIFTREEVIDFMNQLQMAKTRKEVVQSSSSIFVGKEQQIIRILVTIISKLGYDDFLSI